MNIENINTESIKNLEDAKAVLNEIKECIFIMNKDIQRQLNHLTSKNVVSLDFNITQVTNADKILNEEE